MENGKVEIEVVGDRKSSEWRDRETGQVTVNYHQEMAIFVGAVKHPKLFNYRLQDGQQPFEVGAKFHLGSDSINVDKGRLNFAFNLELIPASGVTTIPKKVAS